MTKDEALKLARSCIIASLEYKQGKATAVESVEDIDEMLAQPEQDTVQRLSALVRAQQITIDKLEQALAQPEPDACKHEWFRTGAMEPRECRCIKCGAWNTTPPQRTWVSLMDEEIIIMSRYDLEYAALIGEVQRKLKEKNT